MRSPVCMYHKDRLADVHPVVHRGHLSFLGITSQQRGIGLPAVYCQRAVARVARCFTRVVQLLAFLFGHLPKPATRAKWCGGCCSRRLYLSLFRSEAPQGFTSKTLSDSPMRWSSPETFSWLLNSVSGCGTESGVHYTPRPSLSTPTPSKGTRATGLSGGFAQVAYQV